MVNIRHYFDKSIARPFLCFLGLSLLQFTHNYAISGPVLPVLQLFSLGNISHISFRPVKDYRICIIFEYKIYFFV